MNKDLTPTTETRPPAGENEGAGNYPPVAGEAPSAFEKQAPAPSLVFQPESAGQAGGGRQDLMQLASFGSRFWAFLTDLIVIGLLNSIAANLIGLVFGTVAWYESYFTVNFVFLGLTGSLYFILMTRFFNQTLGKMMMGIQVVHRDGRELSWSTVIFRELVGRTLSQFCGSWLGYLVSLFTPRHEAIHDLVADTFVVKEKFSMERGFVPIPRQDNQAAV